MVVGKFEVPFWYFPRDTKSKDNIFLVDSPGPVI